MKIQSFKLWLNRRVIRGLSESRTVGRTQMENRGFILFNYCKVYRQTLVSRGYVFTRYFWDLV